MITESQYWIWLLHYEANLFSILAKWFPTCIPSIVESSLSSKSNHTIHLPDRGSALWIHSFWVFAIASYLVLLPLLPLYNLFSTRRCSKNPSHIMSLFGSKLTFQLFQRKVKNFPWLIGPMSFNPSPTWKPAPIIITYVFETYHLPGRFTLDIILLLIFFYSVCLLSWTQCSWDYWTLQSRAWCFLPFSGNFTSFNSA